MISAFRAGASVEKKSWSATNSKAVPSRSRARLSENKALPFLVDACRAAREKIGHFSLLIIGDGDYAPWLRQQAETDTWIHPVGPLYGSEKAEMLALADIFLLPSANGLSILDSFAAGLPLLSARFGNHGQSGTHVETKSALASIA